ncbi:MAG: hypothetical protein UX44_C0015G0015 [candidate division WWE3 bacterium GW2011_GWA1_46_21]|uniref:Uncharacterized protein n=1 Tax=candidate division WWE3 bacterium GW2011_GWA1_46_21 TaxID=1619107 RepID=A0A0G1PD37_UNCKA|nr:MAG: hypothetical protein UX44_C0015G0015 [candidate division WWE3 bacterium GW2011_GWA1_46_21]
MLRVLFGLVALLAAVLAGGGAAMAAPPPAPWTKTNLQTTKIAPVETTRWGLLVGENDSRIWLNPFNGART